VFVALPSVTLEPLCRLVNAAVRFVAGLGPRDHNSDGQCELQWPPIEQQRITYKICFSMRSVVTSTAPHYILHFANPGHKLGGRAHLCSDALG